MALPSNRNSGGIPQRPGVPQRPGASSSNGEMPGLPSINQDFARQAREQAAPALPTPQEASSNDRLGQYDFGSQAVERPTKRPVYDEDDPFESLTPSEAFDDDYEEEQAPPPRRRRQAAPVDEYDDDDAALASRRDKRAAEEFSRNQGRRSSERVNEAHEEYRPQAGRLDKKGQNTFVDEKEKKVKPFGGKKSLKVADIDPRKNVRAQAKVVQVIIIVFLILAIAAGIFNALMPKPTLTTEDVVKTVQQTVSISDFPIEGGEGFAKDFMQAYLTLGNDPAAGTVLNYYYSGRMVAGTDQFPNRLNQQGYTQELLYGPTVYKAQYLTDNSANYTIGALVQPFNSKPAPEDDGTQTTDVTQVSNDGTAAQWQFFSVNVFYDQETREYAITPDSPTMIPAPANLSSTAAPDPVVIGTGETIENPESVKAIVQGFMEGYRVSTPKEHIKIDPYVASDAPTELLEGLAGVYNFADDSVESAVQFIPYATDTTEIKVHVTVSWEYAYADNVKTTYQSQYIMTLEPTSTGFIVTKFAPYYYVPEVK